MELRRDGQVAVIPGSSMGIGKAVARAYGLAGARVVLNSRDSTRAQAAAAELTAAGIDAFPVAADLARAAEVTELFAAADQQWGQIDVLVNNAGTSMIAPSERLSLADWQ